MKPFDPEIKKWLRTVVDKGGVAKIEQSEIFMGLFTANYRKAPECALQIGLAILMEKPICLIVCDGEKVPETLKKIAFAIEYVTGTTQEEMHAAMNRIYDKYDKLEKKDLEDSCC